MVESIEFQNFKALRNAILPLGPFTLIVGPNGSGKSTACRVFQYLQQSRDVQFHRIVSAGLPNPNTQQSKITIRWSEEFSGWITEGLWSASHVSGPQHRAIAASRPGVDAPQLHQIIFTARTYSFDAKQIARDVTLQPGAELHPTGANLAGVLDAIRDKQPERFESLNAELGRWLPEFDRVLFDTPQPGQRAFLLRTRRGHHAIPATELSDGTLLALAILTLPFLPQPPTFVAIEEPDRGIHPRLLREVHDAMYRLSHPQSFDEARPPIQVIATTHNPYFLDLFKDHPEEIVIAEKKGLEATFERLSNRKDIEEILGDAPLGEIWYSGILGGVPAAP